MAHFAQIDSNNIVTKVIVISNDVLLDENNLEQESLGQQYISNVLNMDGNWLQTSYNDNFRKHFAGIGWTYDADNDVFIEPKEYDSWILNDNFEWEAPVAMPERREGYGYFWDEDNLQWIEEKHPNWNEDTQSWDIVE